MDDQELVDLLALVWGSIDSLCSGLTEAEWKTPTDCPGWSVQDNLAHIVGIEATLLGRPAPDHEVPELAHVRNDIGRINEIWVDARRALPGDAVLDEFRQVTGERLAVLRGSSEAEFAAESWTPVGPGTVRDLLPFRVFDCWVHEQDMRRALDRPGDLDGPVAANAFERAAGTMPYVVGKKVRPDDGATLVFDVTGSVGRPIGIRVEGSRALRVDEPPADPTVRLTMDFETFSALGCGRWDPDAALADGKVTIDGDEWLGRRVLEEINFLF